MKKPKPIDTFLYQHFKLTGHSPNDVLVQPVEKLTYEKKSSSRFKIIKRHETELKWTKLLQTSFPLGFNFWFDFCFTALQHILGHFEHGQLP